jgi:arginyl-tRNA synthetase
MYKKYGNNAEPNKKPDHFVGDFYAMYEKDVETKPELAQELAQLFQKLESGDTETLDLWKRIVGWTYEGWQTTYANEHIAFDVWMYQSNYKITGKDVVQLALERGVAEKDPTGAVIARLEKYGLPDKVMLRRDGTSVYATQDTQLAKDSYEKYHFDKRIYVVDNRQTDYFKQLFKILELLGFSWYDKLYHLSYGVVSLPEGQMSSRQGLVVNSDEVFGTLVTLENAEIRNSIKDVSSIEDTAKSIALAAYKYDLLKVDPKQDIVFRYDQVTKFVGNTGPYLLYTYARGSSILEKSGYDSISPDPLLVLSEYTLNKSELALLRTLYKFPEVVLSAADKLSPNEIANYVYDVAQKFNTFYASSPILSDTSQLKQFRLALVSCAMQVIKNNVQLLGIKVVERM